MCRYLQGKVSKESFCLLTSRYIRGKVHLRLKHLLQFREQHPKVLQNLKSEVVLHEDKGDSNGSKVTTCYAAGAGPKGWCATCKIAGAPDDPELCKETSWVPTKIEQSDKRW